MKKLNADICKKKKKKKIEQRENKDGQILDKKRSIWPFLSLEADEETS